MKAESRTGVLSVISFLVVSSGCSTASSGNASLSVTGTAGSALTATLDGGTTAGTITRIDFTKVLIVLDDFKFKRSDDDGGTDLKLVFDGPFIVNLRSNTKVAVGDVPAGSYDKIRVDLDKLNDHGDRNVSALPNYDSRLMDKSILVEGTITRGDGTTASFVYTDDMDEEPEVRGAKATVDTSQDGVNNILMVFDTLAWFKAGGTLLDPTDSSNANAIRDSIRDSIRQLTKFGKDQNDDGVTDE